MIEQGDEVLEKAKQLRAAGVPLEEIERYIQSKRGTPKPADDTVEVEANYPERLATTILKGAQVIPGMKSVEALAGSLGSKLTDHPVSYSDAKAGLEEQTDRMKPGLGIAAQVASSPVMAPVFAARGISALSPMAQGAAYGGASEALDYNPDETNFSRVARTGAGAAIGGLLTGAGSGVAKFAKAPPGTVGKVASRAFPRIGKAVREYKALTAPPPETVRPQIRLMEASAPKAEGLMRPEASVMSEPTTLAPRRGQTLEELIGSIATPVEQPNVAEGFVGNSMDNLASIPHEPVPVSPRRGSTLEQLIAPAEETGVLPDVVKATERYRTGSGKLQQGAPNARFEHFADQFAKRQQAGSVTDLSEGDLLKMTLEHIRQGGTLKSAGDAIRMLITR